MGVLLGSFTLIQFSPPTAEGETEETRHGRGRHGSERMRETKFVEDSEPRKESNIRREGRGD